MQRHFFEWLGCSYRLVLRIATDDSKAVCRLSVKFGVPVKACRALLERAKELGLDVIGVSFHVGSGCTDPNAYTQAIADARCVFDIGVSPRSVSLLAVTPVSVQQINRFHPPRMSWGSRWTCWTSAVASLVPMMLNSSLKRSVTFLRRQINIFKCSDSTTNANSRVPH